MREDSRGLWTGSGCGTFTSMSARFTAPTRRGWTMALLLLMVAGFLGASTLRCLAAPARLVGAAQSDEGEDKLPEAPKEEEKAAQRRENRRHEARPGRLRRQRLREASERVARPPAAPRLPVRPLRPDSHAPPLRV